MTHEKAQKALEAWPESVVNRYKALSPEKRAEADANLWPLDMSKHPLMEGDSNG